MSEYRVEQEEDEIIIDLGVFFCDIWKGFKKFWIPFLIICSLMAGLNYGRVALSYMPMYKSQVSFTVSTLTGYDEANTSYSFSYNKSTAEQMEALFPYVLQSDVLTGLVKEELGIEGLETEELKNSVTVKAVPKSNLFTMDVVNSDPEVAKSILDAVMNNIPEVTRYVIGDTKLNIIQPAAVPEKPYNQPDYRKQVVMGAVIGVLICGVWLVLYALFRKTIRKEEELREVLNVRSLGVIPRIKFKAHNKKIDTNASILNDRTGRMFKEAFRSLSLKILRETEEKEKKVILVTSTLPGEGKSTVAMNLALALMERGKKVLLMDMDIRKPTLAERLGETQTAGRLIRTLLGKLPIEESVQQLPSGIYFIGAEKPYKNVSNLLTKAYIKAFMARYRQEMDYIIVDTAPCEVMADATTLARYCDGVVYVIRQDMAKQSQIINGLQKMIECDIPIIGGILNGTDGSISGYGKYGKYGKYGYGKYGYGYGEKKESKK